ncbi:MAG: ComEC/Rec2 family competence protein [Bacteroidota bacterium]
MLVLEGPFTWWILAATVLLLFLAFFLKNDQKLLTPKWEATYLFGSLICGMLLGAALSQTREIKDNTHLKQHEGEQVVLLGEIESSVKTNAYGAKCFLSISARIEGDSTIRSEGRILLYFPKGEKVSYSRYDSIWVKGRLTSVKSKYPSYLAYLHKKGIAHSMFASKVELAGTRKGIGYWSEKTQQYFSEKLTSYLGDSTTLPIGLAIIIGDKDLLKPEQREVFSQAGASHILAISGLHIGIIYLVLNGLLSILHAIPYGRQLKYLIILLALQAYMFATGASPAVVRAVIMFSAILVFRLSAQRYHILNVIALSALIQILVKPDIIHEVGFQLSYLAVIGIVWLYPKFEEIFEKESWLFRNVMAALGVSLFATLFTAPVIGSVFGKFPTYFLITNLFITTVSFLTVLSGFLTLCFCWFTPLAVCCGWICQKSILLMNWICTSVSSLPSPLIEVQRVDQQALWILSFQLMLIGIITVWVRRKRLIHTS